MAANEERCCVSQSSNVSSKSLIREPLQCLCGETPCNKSTEISNLCVHCSSDGKVFVGTEKAAKLYDPQLKLLKEIKLQDQQDGIPCGIFSTKDSNCVLFGSGSHVYRYDIREGKPSAVFNESNDEINDLDLAFDGKRVAAADDSGEVRIYDIRQTSPLKILRNKHGNICSSTRFRPDKQSHLLTGGLDCKLILWDYARLKALRVINVQDCVSKGLNSSSPMLNPPMVNSVDVSKDGKSVACGLGNGAIQLLTFGPRQNLIHHSFLQKHSSIGVTCLRFESLDSQELLLAGGNDSLVTVWQLNAANEDPKSVTPSLLRDVVNVNSKINSIGTYKLNSTVLCYIADQTCCLKYLKIE